MAGPLTLDAIHAGLNDGEFFLEYMPTVSLADGRCLGAEARQGGRRDDGRLKRRLLGPVRLPVGEGPPLRRGKRARSHEERQQEQENRAPGSRTAASLNGLKDGVRHGLGDSGGGV